MESDPWSIFFQSSSSSRRHQSSLQSRSDSYFSAEEVENDEDPRVEFPCPFCSEDFDIASLCCHIDEEHPSEAKNGICPVCATRVGIDMVGHITLHHGHFFKLQRRRRLRKGPIGPQSTLNLFRKEVREGYLQSLLGGSACVVPSSDAAPDPLLSSFMYNSSVSETAKSVHSQTSLEGNLPRKSTDEKVMKSTKTSSLSEKEQKEKSRRCEFVQGLLLSTIFDYVL